MKNKSLSFGLLLCLGSLLLAQETADVAKSSDDRYCRAYRNLLLLSMGLNLGSGTYSVITGITVRRLQDDVRTCLQEIARKNKTIIELTEKNNKQEKRIDSLETENRRFNQLVNELQSANNALSMELGACKAETSANRNKIAALQNLTKDLQAKVADQTTRIKGLSAEVIQKETNLIGDKLKGVIHAKVITDQQAAMNKEMEELEEEEFSAASIKLRYILLNNTVSSLTNTDKVDELPTQQSELDLERVRIKMRELLAGKNVEITEVNMNSKHFNLLIVTDDTTGYRFGYFRLEDLSNQMIEFSLDTLRHCIVPMMINPFEEINHLAGTQKSTILKLKKEVLIHEKPQPVNCPSEVLRKLHKDNTSIALSSLKYYSVYMSSKTT